MATRDKLEEEGSEQEEYERALHAVAWPDLEDEPEEDPELKEEIDSMLWEIFRDQGDE